MSNSKCDTFTNITLDKEGAPGQFFTVGQQNNSINRQAQKSVYYRRDEVEGFTTMRFGTVALTQEAARILARIGCEVLVNSEHRTVKAQAKKR